MFRNYPDPWMMLMMMRVGMMITMMMMMRMMILVQLLTYHNDTYLPHATLLTEHPALC